MCVCFVLISIGAPVPIIMGDLEVQDWEVGFSAAKPPLHDECVKKAHALKEAAENHMKSTSKISSFARNIKFEHACQLYEEAIVQFKACCLPAPPRMPRWRVSRQPSAHRHATTLTLAIHSRNSLTIDPPVNQIHPPTPNSQLARQWEEAAECYKNCAYLQTTMKRDMDAAVFYQKAADLFMRCNLYDAIINYQRCVHWCVTAESDCAK